MILEKLQQVFLQVFENKNIAINRNSSPANIDGWNSLNHVLLINEIENAFHIQFSLDEMIELSNVGDIIDCIEKKNQTSSL